MNWLGSIVRVDYRVLILLDIDDKDQSFITYMKQNPAEFGLTFDAYKIMKFDYDKVKQQSQNPEKDDDIQQLQDIYSTAKELGLDNYAEDIKMELMR